MGLKSSAGGGEIVEVQGGHIIRATGRKDRHSKVFTAKGPRDRRVRLSAHTAIQFYDVQDRLGYDRPSKAVDWLIKKAKASIDKLAELPPWDPMSSGPNVVDANGGRTEFHVGDYSGSSSFYVPQQPQCLDSQPLGVGGDSMKSFFPMNGGSNNGAAEQSISFQHYPHDMVSRGGCQNQDLCLSLHTLQGPSGGGSGDDPQTNPSHDLGLFRRSGSSLGFDGGTVGWGETHNPHELARFTKMLGWPNGVGCGNGVGGGGDTRGENLFNAPSFSQGSLLGQQGPVTSATYSQRGTLQSNFAPLVRVLDHQQHQYEFSNTGHRSDQFMGFYIPSQLHDHQLHVGANSVPNNRASSSSLSPDSSQH